MSTLEIITFQTKQNKQPRICVMCHKTFLPKRGQGGAKTCSYECSGALERKRVRDRYPERFRK